MKTKATVKFDDLDIYLNREDDEDGTFVYFKMSDHLGKLAEFSLTALEAASMSTALDALMRQKNVSIDPFQLLGVKFTLE